MIRSATVRVAGMSVLALLLSACGTENVSTEKEIIRRTIKPITLKELTKLDPSKRTLVDARSPDAFNGWVLQKEKVKLNAQGGHIPGAQLMSARWIEQGLDDLDLAWERTEAELGDKIVIYGQSQKQAQTVADWLIAEQNFSAENLRLLKQGPTEWSRKAAQPLDFLPGFRTLVPPEYVAQTLITKPDTTVVEIGWDGGKARAYRGQHISGAIYWDDLEFEFPPIYEARPVEDIRTSLAGLGIDKDSSVIVYSTDSIGAARGASIMKYAGVEDVVMLNGGINAWTAAGFETETGWNEPVAIADFGVTGPGDNSIIVDIDEAKQIRSQSDGALVSIRSWREFIGAVSGYDYFSKRGRIPGALWGHAGNSSWDMSHFHNPDNTMRNYHQIADFWQEWGIRPDMSVSFYCGNGWRASESWWYAQAMGYDRSTIYSSGWMRWREDGDNPVGRGEISREQALAEWREVSGQQYVVSDKNEVKKGDELIEQQTL